MASPILIPVARWCPGIKQKVSKYSFDILYASYPLTATLTPINPGTFFLLKQLYLEFVSFHFCMWRDCTVPNQCLYHFFHLFKKMNRFFISRYKPVRQYQPDSTWFLSLLVSLSRFYRYNKDSIWPLRLV